MEDTAVVSDEAEIFARQRLQDLYLSKILYVSQETRRFAPP